MIIDDLAIIYENHECASKDWPPIDRYRCSFSQPGFKESKQNCQKSYIQWAIYVLSVLNWNYLLIDQFRYIKIQSKTKDLSTRLWGITTEFVGLIPQSPVLRYIVLRWILIYIEIGQLRLMRGVFSNVNDIHLFLMIFPSMSQASFSKITRIRKWTIFILSIIQRNRIYFLD